MSFLTRGLTGGLVTSGLVYNDHPTHAQAICPPPYTVIPTLQPIIPHLPTPATMFLTTPPTLALKALPPSHPV